MSINRLLGSAATDTAEKVIGFTMARQKVLADNLANLDTPGYRVKDLAVADFNQALGEALARAQQQNPNLPRLEVPGPMDAVKPGSPADRLRGIVFHDDNDRSIERLVTTMNDNRVRMNNAINMLRSQVRILRTVVTERPQS